MIEHNTWVNEVIGLYKKVRSHKDSYIIEFIDFGIEVFPNVFSPKYFNNTKWYAETLPGIIGNKKLLEIGTGTGAIAIQCNLKGASVTATDINIDACNCAESNVKRNECEIPVYHGDVFEPLPHNLRFDYVFWNHPYNKSAESINDNLLIAGFDYNYNSLRKYIQYASAYLLDPNKGLLLGTGGQADIASINEIAEENGYQLELLNIIEMPLGEGTKAPNDFRIYELTRIEDTMSKDDLWKLYTSTSDWIRAADMKAFFVIGVVTIMLTLFGVLMNLEKTLLFKSTLSLTALVCSGLFFLVSILTSVSILYSVLNTEHNRKKSILYFKDIAENHDAHSFANSIDQVGNLKDELLSQIFILSTIARSKHVKLQNSIWFLRLAIIALALSLISSLVF